MIAYIKAIADALCGEDTSGSGDVMRTSLGRIAEYVEEHPSPSGGGGVLVVDVVTTGEGQEAVSSLNKTAGEIMTAFKSGVVILHEEDYPGGPESNATLASAIFNGQGYLFTGSAMGGMFTAVSATDYPTGQEIK